MTIELLTRKEMAARARVSVQHIDKLIKRGKGPHVFRLGYRVLCAERNFNAWLANLAQLGE